MTINEVLIENFKSIKKLQFDCKEINIFIGEPNVGKSNILEALSVFSEPIAGGNPTKFIRMKTDEDLFYFHDVTREIIINAGGDYQFSGKRKHSREYNFDYIKRIEKSAFRYYKYDKIIESSDFMDYLLPANGSNLLVTLTYFPEIRKIITNILNKYDLKLLIKQAEQKLSLYKELDEGTVFDLHYDLLSDTLLRMIFYYVAILSNKDAVLIFEEPETKSFPEYTKELAYEISRNKNNNQYFISTHNIYMLIKVLEKTQIEKIAVNLVFFNKKENRTDLVTLSNDEIQEALEMDIDFFLNIHRFLPED